MKFSQVRPFKSILVPVDFTSLSHNAIHYAIRLAKLLDARVHLFHAVHIPATLSIKTMEIPDRDRLVEDAKLKLAQIRDNFEKTTGFPDIDILINVGLAVDVICETVETAQVDLVIMATNGASGLDELILGSNTAAVTEKCSCPVLSIPFDAEFNLPKRIFFATNYLDNDFQSIFLLTQYFKNYRPEIIIGHVEEKNSHKIELNRFILFQDQVRRNITYDRLSFVLLRGNSVKEALNEHLQNNSYDLISTSIRHRNLFERLTSKSLTKKLVNHANLPLLAFHTIRKPALPFF